ncbi:actin-binding protein [Trichomonascus vanleenenianus]|uniref:actin-binding protein n=1 Tax=Trichomonascus vanleenenianus TaxID=2268995 RepID=UPI003ECAAE20
MSYTIDLATHGGELKRAYDAIVSSDPDVSWAVFNYGQNNSLSLRAKGADDLSEFVEEFDDGKIQYGLARVMLDNLPKIVLVGWVGEGVPERTKGYFNAHFSSVARYFPGYHVQITARSADDLSENIILQRVHDSAGSKYASVRGRVPTKPSYKVAPSGASEEDWGDAPQVKEGEITKVAPAYKPTKVDLHSIRSGKTERPEAVKSSYEPVGKVDIAALRAQGKNQFNPKPEPLQSSYKPIGKVDIAAIRAQAKASPKYSESHESKPIKTPEPAAANEEEETKPTNVRDRISTFGGNYGSLRSAKVASTTTSASNEDEEEAPKPVKERMAAFSSTNSGRLTELPKPKPSKTVSSRFGAGAARPGTAPSLPTDVFSTAPKVSGGFKNYAAEGGKTPAQLWAEKHGKAAPAPTSVEPPVNASQQQEEEEETDVSVLRNKFAQASVEEEEPKASFSDLTSKFAQKASTSPSPQPERAVPPPPTQERAVPPPPERTTIEHEPIMLANPVPRAKEPSPEPEVEPSRSEVPKAPALSSNPVVAAAQAEVAAAVGTAPAESAPSAIALFDYEKDEENEIEFAENDIIVEIDFVDNDWWYGTNPKGESGLFPASYVELRESNAPAAPAATASATTTAPAPVPAPVPAPPAEAEPEKEAKPFAIAEYDYDADEEGEISFKEGEKISDLEFPDEDWWSGTNAKGETGLFPANYVSLQ